MYFNAITFPLVQLNDFQAEPSSLMLRFILGVCFLFVCCILFTFWLPYAGRHSEKLLLLFQLQCILTSHFVRVMPSDPGLNVPPLDLNIFSFSNFHLYVSHVSYCYSSNYNRAIQVEL